MATFTNPFPSWGDTGSSPSSGKDYGAEQVFAEHFDYLWDQLNKTFDSIITEFDTEVIRRDGTVAMNADLDVGSNDIINATDITASGIVSASDLDAATASIGTLDGGGSNITINESITFNGPTLDLTGGQLTDVQTINGGGDHVQFTDDINFIGQALTFDDSGATAQEALSVDGSDNLIVGGGTFTEALSPQAWRITHPDATDNGEPSNTPALTLTADGANNIGMALALVPGQNPGGNVDQDKAEIFWFGRDGEIMARMGAHEGDNEFSIYTRDETAFDGSQGGHYKRLNIDGGAQTGSVINWESLQRWEFRGDYGSGDEIQMRLRADPGAHSLFYHYEDTTPRVELRWHGGDENYWLRVDDGSGTLEASAKWWGDHVVLFDDTAQPGTSTTPAIQIGPGGAGFFINASGEVEVVDEAGNTTVIS